MNLPRPLTLTTLTLVVCPPDYNLEEIQAEASAVAAMRQLGNVPLDN